MGKNVVSFIDSGYVLNLSLLLLQQQALVRFRGVVIRQKSRVVL